MARKIVCDWIITNKETKNECEIYCVEDAVYDEKTNQLIIHSYGFTHRMPNIEKFTITMRYRLITDGEEIISQSTEESDHD